ncbi:hypothetical protein ACOMHN_016547 [Nucella lapillus]
MVAAICILVSAVAVTGTLFFSSQNDGKVYITGQVEGLAPGPHGFHIHEYGDTRNDCKLAGGHFDTANMTHGGPADEIRLKLTTSICRADKDVGDLGNIIADQAGVAEVDIRDCRIALSGTNSVIGRGVMIHQGEDPLGQSKPATGAGVRVACGLIGLIA